MSIHSKCSTKKYIILIEAVEFNDVGLPYEWILLLPCAGSLVEHIEALRLHLYNNVPEDFKSLFVVMTVEV